MLFISSSSFSLPCILFLLKVRDSPDHEDYTGSFLFQVKRSNTALEYVSLFMLVQTKDKYKAKLVFSPTAPIPQKSQQSLSVPLFCFLVKSTYSFQLLSFSFVKFSSHGFFLKVAFSNHSSSESCS